jgi:hypothetical protein
MQEKPQSSGSIDAHVQQTFETINQNGSQSSPQSSLNQNLPAASFDFIKKYTDLVTSFSNLENNINSLKKDNKDLEDSFRELRIETTELKNERIRTIEMISVFVALIAFVSAQVNIFKDQTIGAALAFTLIMAGVLVIFVLLVHFVSRSLIYDEVMLIGSKKIKIPLPSFLFIFTILLIAFGILIIQREGFSKKIGNDDARILVQPINNINSRR